MTGKDDLLFAESSAVASDREEKAKPEKYYKLLVVDDDPGVHEVTRMALSRFTFNDYGLELLHAHSGEEAKEVLERTPEIAVVLLDVVMETSEAGLEVADWIRNDLKDRRIRIVLRTGQPGEAPESDIMVRYDINDYKEKTELTNRKLNTLMYACLRAYNDIDTIERASSKLQNIIESSGELFKPQSGEQFSALVINLLTEILLADRGVPPSKVSSITCKNGRIVCATGNFSDQKGKDVQSICSIETFDQLRGAGVDNVKVIGNEIFVYIKSNQNEFMIYVEQLNAQAEIDMDIMSLFFRHVSIGYRNLQDQFDIA